MINKKNKLFFFLLVSAIILVVLLIVSLVLQTDSLLKYVQYFSTDKTIKITTLSVVKLAVAKMLLLALAFDLCLIVIFRINLSRFQKGLSGVLDRIEWNKLNRLTQHKNVTVALIALFLGYFVTICLLIVFTNDVGADEGLYISSVKNFYESGQFNLPWYDYSEVALQLVYYPFYFLRLVFPFSIYSLRLVSLFYSITLLGFLYYVSRKHYSLKLYLILIIMLSAEKAFVFVSSSGFGEIAALLPLVIGVYVWTTRRSKYNVIVCAALFALAGLTKLQVLPLIFAVILLFMIFQQDLRSEHLRLLIVSCILWIIGAFIFAFNQGYDIAAIGRSFWRLAGESGAIADTLSALNRAAHVNSFFYAVNPLIFTIINVYYIFNFRRITQFERMLFIFTDLISLWWIFAFAEITVRNLIYAIVLNYLLLSIIIFHLLSIRVEKARHFLLWVFSVFVVFMFVNSVVFNVRLINKEYSDEFNFAIMGYETVSKKVLKSSQVECFRYINEQLASNTIIYYISVDYYKYIYTNKEFVPIQHGVESLDFPEGSYFLLTYIDYKNDYVWDELKIYLNNHADLVFKQNFYEIYRINE